MEFLANWLAQGSIVVVATSMVLRFLRHARAGARYWVCIAGLSSVVVLPLVPPLAALVWRQDAVAGPVSAQPALVSLPLIESSTTLILAAWAVWLVACGAQLVNATVRVAGARRRFRAFPNVAEDRLRHWVRMRGQGRKARLVVSDDVRAAAVIGGGSPAIGVAPALVEHLTSDELDRVVIHEWAHVQRRDDLANVAQLIARLLVGWHPAVWWIDRRLQAEREAACDEMAVSVTGSSKAYAACLLKLAGLHFLQREALPAVGVLSSATVSARIRRVVAHERRASPAWSRNGAAAGIVVLFGACWGIGSLRVVDAVVSPGLDVTRVAVQPTLEPPIGESPQSSVASLEVTPPRRTLQKPSRQGPAARRSNVRAAALPSSALLAAPGVNALADSPGLETTDLSADVPTSATSEGASAPDIPLSAAPVQMPSEREVAPWAAAANAAITLGERSKKGGLATGAYFTRLGKRIADSF